MPVWRKPDELQLGSGASANRIAALTPSQQRLVQILMRGVAENQFETIANEIGVEDSGDLLERLRPMLVQPNQPVANLDREFVERNFAELCRIQAVINGEPSLVIQQRKSHSVFVDSVAWRDVLVTALLDSGIGSTIGAEAKPRHRERVSVAITIDQSAFRPASHRTWLSLGVPQIAILFDQAGVSISPIIETGITPCLTCLQAAGDSEQIAIDSQLLFSNQRFDDSVAKHFAIAMALHLALARIDAPGSFTAAEFHRTGYRFDSATGGIHELSWKFSENCWCHLGSARGRA